MKDLLRIVQLLGGLFAVILSWTVNHSVFWVILHFFFGWFYVIYYYLVHQDLAPLVKFFNAFTQ
jgi:hypothetical protein